MPIINIADIAIVKRSSNHIAALQNAASGKSLFRNRVSLTAYSQSRALLAAEAVTELALEKSSLKH